MADAWHDPETWDGLATWTTIAFTPMFVFLSCVLQPDVEVTRVLREQWFYSTSQGPHRILAEWHTVWLLAACLCGGVAQFLAWREGGAQWYYPAAMCVFYASVAAQWAWIAAYFRLVNKFRTGRACLALVLCADAALAGLYAPLHKVSAGLVLARALLHDLPMFVVATSAVRIHADPTSPRARGPRPDRPHVRREAERSMTPPPEPPPETAWSKRASMTANDIMARLVPTDARPPV